MSSQSPSNSSSPSLRPGGAPTTDESAQGAGPAAAFGPNEWLVDEIYQQYLQDPNSVDRATEDRRRDPGHRHGHGHRRGRPGNGLPAAAPQAPP
ncbi:2-oxoglutarate dehydrogenase E1 subunit family protein, partial [Streptomyces clavuligerus]|uniref:2-oxoglutarate dehydrogenase E1 subunit family protein n=1 Tax=Streptomyces clavuligerus TaxID=1901 RepID=UPI0018D021BC